MTTLLAIDIGNTTVSIGLVANGKVKKIWSVATRPTDGSLKIRFKRALLSARKDFWGIDSVVICSVVPNVTVIIKPIIKKVLAVRPLVIGQDIKVPIKNCYRKPKEVGQDRLVCAYGAMVLYGAPAIVIDFGTAITFDVVSKKGEYLGGAIIPGLRLYAESLFEKTALLPKVKIQAPEGVIGRDTANSILSGIFYGYGVLCDGMIDLMTKEMKQKPIVIVTGGYSNLIKKFIKRINYADKFLIFRGISAICNAYCCCDNCCKI